MSIENWCVHHASLPGGIEARPACPRTEGWGEANFVYVLTHARELLPFEEQLAAIRVGRPRPRVIKVAMRRTFAEVDRLATRWAERAAGGTR